MNRKDLIDAILKEKKCAQMSKKDAENFLTTMMDQVKKAVKRGDDVSLVGFGTFTRVRGAARSGVNPSTGEKIKIKARTVPKFRPGKAWKEML